VSTPASLGRAGSIAPKGALRISIATLARARGPERKADIPPWGSLRNDLGPDCQRSPKESHPGSPIEGRCGTVTGLLGAWSI
jgi:hypothetical protein